MFVLKVENDLDLTTVHGRVKYAKVLSEYSVARLFY